MSDAPSSKHSIKVLVVDDEPSFTRMLERNLAAYEELEVKAVNESPEAGRIAPKFRPDIVLLDIQMPEVDGGDLARHLRGFSELAQTPILFISAMVSPKEAGGGLFRSGGEQFMAKPVNVELLVQAIYEMIGRTPPRKSRF